jgi:hypothetical protein
MTAGQSIIYSFIYCNAVCRSSITGDDTLALLCRDYLLSIRHSSKQTQSSERVRRPVVYVALRSLYVPFVSNCYNSSFTLTVTSLQVIDM